MLGVGPYNDLPEELYLIEVVLLRERAQGCITHMSNRAAASVEGGRRGCKQGRAVT